jgi:hypothetical protein
LNCTIMNEIMLHYNTLIENGKLLSGIWRIKGLA